MTVPTQQIPSSATPPSDVNRILSDPENIRRILAGMTEVLHLDPARLQVFTWEMTANPDVPNIEGLDGVLRTYGIEGLQSTPGVSHSARTEQPL